MKTNPEARSSGRNLKARFEAVTQRAARRILKNYTRILAIAVDGSVGRRRPLPYSDIDMYAIVAPERKLDPLYYFDNGCYVAIWFIPTRKKTGEKGIHFYYARGGSFTARPLYDPRGILKRHIRMRKNSTPTAELVESILWDAYTNIIEYAGKLRNGRLIRDEYLTRYAARIISQKSENAIIALNDISPMSENVVWHLVMRAKNRPEHFAKDYPVALGLKGTAETKRVFSSALRLAQESLRFIRESYVGKARHRNFRALLNEPLEQLEL